MEGTVAWGSTVGERMGIACRRLCVLNLRIKGDSQELGNPRLQSFREFLLFTGLILVFRVASIFFVFCSLSGFASGG